MSKLRVNILTAVNAANVSKTGSTYTVRDVVHAIDGIVLNERLYPGDELAKSVAGLNGRPAPAGHPKDSRGRHISASNGEALSAAWIGAYCTNSRFESGRALCDIVINGAQAQALPAGQQVINRLDAAIDGTNTDPIGVSSGLMLREIAHNGESRGKKYRAIAADMQFDHLAILLNERPAGTPEEGIGMFVNAEGGEQPVEVVPLDAANAGPDDKRSAGLMRWVARLLGNSSGDLSFDAITSRLHEQLHAIQKGAWLREVFDRYAVWTDESGRMFRQDYSVSSDGSVAFAGTAIEVTRKVEYEPITNRQEGDPVKDKILAALNAAGIKTEGLDESALLAAYNSLVVHPVQAQLTAAVDKIAGIEANTRAAEQAEAATLATELAANSALTADDLKALPLARLRELKANAKAAPVLPGAGGQPGDEFAGYSINAHLQEAK